MDPSATSRRARRRAAGAACLLLAPLVAVAGAAPVVGAQTAPPTSEAETTSTAATDAEPDVEPDGASASTTLAPVAVPDPPGTPLPAPLVAPASPVADDVPAPLRVEGFHVAPGLRADEPLVVVTFADLFELPDAPWRVSVLVGDPAGERRRLSLVADGGEVGGAAAVGDGTTWTPDGAIDVTFDPSGLVGIPLDRATVPAGHGTAPTSVWVEVSLDEGEGGARTEVTPWYDLPSLLGEGTAGVLEGGHLAGLEPEPGDPGDPVVVDLGPGPTLGIVREQGEVVRSTILVRYPGPAPEALGDLPLAEVIDRVEVAPDGVGGATVTPYIEINRTTGAVRLVDPRQWPVVDATGDGSWRRDDASVGVPGEAATLAFDLDAVLAALGETPDRATVALGLVRTQILPDGRAVVASGVLGTTAWLDTAVSLALPAEVDPTPAPATTSVPAASDEVRSGTPWWAVALVVGLLIVGASLIVSGRRRRSARQLLGGGGDPEPALHRSVPPVDELDPTAGRAGDARDDPSGEPRRDASDDGATDGPASDQQSGHEPSGEQLPAPPPADDPEGSVAAARGPWWRLRGTQGTTPHDDADADAPPPARPKHHAEGVTIDAALVTELVDPVDPIEPAAGAADPRHEPAAAEPEVEAAPTPAGPAPHVEAPAVADDADGGLGADVDALEERLRRLGGST